MFGVLERDKSFRCYSVKVEVKKVDVGNPMFVSPSVNLLGRVIML